MRKIKGKLKKITYLALALSLVMCNNIFAAQVEVGSGNTRGWVWGYNGIGGNGSTGYYSEGSTNFTSLGNACTGVRVGIEMTLRDNYGSLLYYDDKRLPAGASGKTVTVSLHSGFFSESKLESTTRHYLSGALTYSTTEVRRSY